VGIRIIPAAPRLVCGPVTLYLLHQAVQPGLALILAAHGFTDHASAIGVGLAAWDEVEAVSTTFVMGRTLVAVKLRDPLPSWIGRRFGASS
jgi:hypothetical protein